MENKEELVENKKETNLESQLATPKTPKLKRCNLTDDQMIALSVRRIADVLGPAMKNQEQTR